MFISAQVLLSVFQRDTSTELTKLRALCTYVGTASAEQSSHVEVLAGFINEIWRDGPPVVVKAEVATNIVLCALLTDDGGEVGAERAHALTEKLNEAPRAYLASWLKDGWIRPSDLDEEDGPDA